MRKVAIFGMVAVFLLALMLQNAAAYTTYDFRTPYVSGHYDPYYGASYSTSYDHKPTYYYTKYPAIYRKYKYSGTSEDPVLKWIDQGDSFEDKVKRARAAAWVTESYDWRYNYASGKPSGYVFGGDEKPAESYSNWRYEPAYDPRVYGPGNTYTQRY
ncbi:hypothetical protein KJ708_08495, partial [bacterium]|nr:hypothetical protein [bacterium]